MSVFSSPSFDGHELVAFAQDADSGLNAIVAVHNTALGNAVGGCRFYPYANDNDALEDALRLSRGMTYKSALAGLPMGGGKAVIMGDPATDKTPELLKAMGRFVDGLGGKYITAEDSGTSVADMKIIGETTSFVSGVGNMDRFGGDPSPYTAYGIYCSIVAAVNHKLAKQSLEGISVAVQGAGSVGRFLIERLVKNGAKVFVADINEKNLAAAQALGAVRISTDTVLSADVDVLAPCAMGAVLNDNTLAEIKAPIIAGGANNQLAEAKHGRMLAELGILYAPDFVVNAGGIIAVHHQRMGSTEEAATEHVANIAETLTEIFRRSEASGQTTEDVAGAIAEERFRTRVKQ